MHRTSICAARTLKNRAAFSKRSYSLAEAFETISYARHAERSFSSAEVSDDTLRKIVELTLLAPTSFNLQPYKIILIKSQDSKRLLSTAMNPGNDKHVNTAAFTAVFVADTDPARNSRKLIELERASGAHPSYISSLPAKITLLLGKGTLSNRLRAFGSHLMSPLTPSPVIRPTNDAWGMKNASFAAMQFMLAATACGLRTHPMEGFDERRLSAILSIPEDYVVPVVISVGHSADPNDPLRIHVEKEGTVRAQRSGGNETDSSSTGVATVVRLSNQPKPRFSVAEMCFEDQFGNSAPFL